MNSLTFEQMENVNGGASALEIISCSLGVIALVVAFIGLVTATGGLALIAGAVGFSIAPTAAALACLDLMT
ncbi:MAG: hypothetical protein LBC84_05175 [Prevotellaceae bacterium]|jgi:hypothetical protein|nr:hypothetical protein [Prevotellaceae bacterium]